MKTIYLNKNDIPVAMRGGYGGNKFAVEVVHRVTLQGTHWSGGSRNSYSVYSFASNSTSSIAADSAPTMFGTDYDGEHITLQPEFCVVKHSTFCGTDMGLTFYIHADNAARLLPDTDGGKLTDAELCLLEATSGYKASYGGRKPRIDMMHNNGFSDDDIQIASDNLKSLKLLNKAGAITVSGRNARPDRDTFKKW